MKLFPKKQPPIRSLIGEGIVVRGDINRIILSRPAVEAELMTLWRNQARKPVLDRLRSEARIEEP